MSGLSDETCFEHILVHYRWVFVCIFLLPASFFFNIWLYVRNWIVFKLNSAPKEHNVKVKNVQQQVSSWIKNGMRTKMCTARPGWQTMSFRRGAYKHTMHNIHVNLMDIIEVNQEKKTVLVEPMVNMGQLSATLNPLGWTIPVVPELDDLTVGGMVMGTGIESSSHKHGLFHEICVSYELVLSDGSVVKCSREENPELFHAIPWSYGTLGILTAAEIKIIPAKKYIRLKYEAFVSFKAFEDNFINAVKGNSEFVEGILFDREKGVVMTGEMCDTPEIDKINCIGRWYKPWFFTHVESMLEKPTSIEYIPLRDYYHRHTRSIFWELQDIIAFGNNLIFRFLFGWLMPPKVSLLKLTQTEAVKKLYETKHVLQDMLVPLEKLGESVLVFDEVVKVYPVWLCPFVLRENFGMLQSGDQGMYVDIGTYGVPHAERYEAKESTRKLEAFVRKVKGFQMLYADTYMTKKEFREMFDHQLYDKMRNQLKCENAFPEVYDKISKAARI